MNKFWVIFRQGSNQLVDRPPLPDRAEALVVAARLATEDIKSRFVVLEAVACTTKPVVQVGTEDL